MEKLQKKLKKQGGFTLVEMLIVVAIIAILIAVSIPMVSGALDRAKEATDAANVRAAKAAASITKLDPGSGKEINWEDTNGKNVINAYDAEKGIIVGLSADAQAPATYGKKEKGRIYLVIDDDVVYYQWGESTPTESDPTNESSGWKTEVKVSE